LYCINKSLYLAQYHVCLLTILEQTPVSDNIAIASSVFYGKCPAYLTNIVEPAGAGRTRIGLRSTSFTDYTLPRLRTKFAERAFSTSHTQDRLHGTDCRKICVPWLIQLSSENTWKLTSSLQPIMFTDAQPYEIVHLPENPLRHLTHCLSFLCVLTIILCVKYAVTPLNGNAGCNLFSDHLQSNRICNSRGISTWVTSHRSPKIWICCYQSAWR